MAEWKRQAQRGGGGGGQQLFVSVSGFAVVVCAVQKGAL